MDTVRWFKRVAKRRLRAAREGDEVTLTWVRRHRFKVDNLTLMGVQHCLARDAGFIDWGDLLKASDERRLVYINKGTSALTPIGGKDGKED